MGESLDKQLKIQHIDIEYSVVVLATPSKEVSYDVRGGYGIMCHWKPRERLAAYRGLRDWVDTVITKMEKEL